MQIQPAVAAGITSIAMCVNTYGLFTNADADVETKVGSESPLPSRALGFHPSRSARSGSGRALGSGGVQGGEPPPRFLPRISSRRRRRLSSLSSPSLCRLKGSRSRLRAHALAYSSKHHDVGEQSREAPRRLRDDGVSDNHLHRQNSGTLTANGLHDGARNPTCPRQRRPRRTPSRSANVSSARRRRRRRQRPRA